MDYFSVIVLIIVVFLFMSDRNAKRINNIIKENNKILEEVRKIQKDLKIIKVTTKDMQYNKILKWVEGVKQKYILIQNSKINLKDKEIIRITANYVVSKKRPCGFNLIYSYNRKFNRKKWSLKHIYVDIINYLNIFNKKELSTYGVIIFEKTDIINSEKTFKENLISYTPEEFTNINFTPKEIEKEKIKKIYIDKISKANVGIILKFLLLIISGTIITTNLIYSILNANNISELIISALIYYCYSYIIRYIYKPIGKQRFIASYIFPVYFMAYSIVSIYNVIIKVIERYRNHKI